jgi:hypothetical protein
VTDRRAGALASGPDLGLWLRILAPYLAVLVFWVGFHSAWLAILAYHAQILLWLRGSRVGIGSLKPDRLAWLAVPSAFAGPALYVVLPYVVSADFPGWLRAYGLSGTSLLAMVFYFGLVHPVLEQLHWARLREQTPAAHLFFAGYHLIVLYSLLTVPWLAVCFVVLAGASIMWQQMGRRGSGLLVPIASHAFADLGIATAAFLLA